ncbi:MAG: hypothetical protein KKE62_00890 [Proteobacteria bacterium]|nr:hypothetical protein [Pseudomonadota bacterium]MBU1386340.1 hypothetical protein [Pseudomonadota bacterium]MBU1541374.1 hypothetical protein [Pseudomonadota bacterium]MBU2430599.1 hypothetical protein [Pseudomonadota bacterium]MBU2482501.1 hypothetical protein [Pseudomonadota bacterium]
MSVKCEEAHNHETAWHLGIIKNISASGLVIEAHSLKTIKIASNVQLIYFPQKEMHTPPLVEPEPVKKTGRLIWQSPDKKTIGIQLDL